MPEPITADTSGRYICECSADEQHPHDDHLRVGTPEIYEYSEIPILVRRDGRATNRWADGVAGVPTQLQERAELEIEAYCDNCCTYAEWVPTNIDST